MKDQRMKNKTLGLIIMLVPEMVSKIDTFREELAKVLLYKFHKVYKINQVNRVFLKDIISSYNKILKDLLSFKQAELLSEQILEFLQVKEKPKKKKTITDIGVIYPKEYTSFIKIYYASLLGSMPYTETTYSADKAVIKTQTHEFSFVITFGHHACASWPGRYFKAPRKYSSMGGNNIHFEITHDDNTPAAQSVSLSSILLTGDELVCISSL